MSISFDPKSLQAQAEGASTAAAALAKQLELANARVAAKRIEFNTARDQRLAKLTPAERRQVQAIESRRHDGSLDEFRQTIVQETRESRATITEQLKTYAERAQKAEQLFQTPGHLLSYKGGLGTERRAFLDTSVERAGHAELIALRMRAEAEGDLELGAAIHSRVARMERKDRPFDPSALATTLVGKDFEKLQATIATLRASAASGLRANGLFEVGRELTPLEKIELGLASPRRSERDAIAESMRGAR